MDDILADAERYRAEAIATLEQAKAGAALPPGVTVADLEDSIETYERTLRRYGRLPNA